jgi:hypothetical protein
MGLRARRIIAFFISLAALVAVIYTTLPSATPAATLTPMVANGGPAEVMLAQLPIKGRAPQTGYSREQFGNGWAVVNGCDTREVILNRDLTQVVTNDKCQVTKGVLQDPYTGKTIQFSRGAESSSAVQIDHVVALGDAWQKGAQQLSKTQREALANDPLELLAVDGPANQQKSDGDAATWLPPNKSFRCEYVARQIAVKKKYSLWVTQAEHDAMTSILNGCPTQMIPA